MQTRNDFTGLSPGGKTHTFSVWVKSNVAGLSYELYLGPSDTDKTIETFTTTTEWQRVSVTHNFRPDDTNIRVVMEWSGALSGSSTNEIHAWGAQLERTSTPSNYVKTTDQMASIPAIAIDDAGNNDGALVGVVWVDGIFGKALEFDGNDDHVSIPHDPDIAFDMAADFTISFWARKDSSDNDDGFFITKRVGNDDFWGIQSSNANEWVSPHFCENGECGTSFATPSGSFPHNTWNHAVVVHTQNNVQVYVNGVRLVDGTKSVAKSGNYNAENILIGSLPTQEYFKGMIDEVKIYNRALSEQEVKTLYTIGSQVNPGEVGTVKIYGLSKGTHNLRLCTASMCNSAILTIT